MHHYLMTTLEWQVDTNWTHVASSAGIPDHSAFVACLRSRATTARLVSDSVLAASLNVSATPSFFTVTRRAVGALSVSQILSLAGESTESERHRSAK